MPPRRGTLLTAARLRDAFGTSAFSSASALALGFTSRQLEQAARSGAIVRIRRGLYVVRDDAVERHRGLIRSAIDRLRDRGTEAIVIGRSAAVLWGIGDVTPHDVHVMPAATLAVPSTSTHHAGRGCGIHLRKIDIPPDHVARLPDGLHVTTPLRTGVDLAYDLRKAPGSALAALCLAARRDIEVALRCSDARRLARELDDLELTQHRIVELESIPAAAHLRGSRPLLSLVDRVSAAPENPFEALSWAAFALSSLPRPLCQRWVQGASGRWYRVDFLWPESGLIGEADGAVTYSSATDVLAEKRRQADLEAAGYRFVRWLWEDVVPHPHAVLARVGRALAERAVRAPRDPRRESTGRRREVVDIGR